jgi:hypothetical protein
MRKFVIILGAAAAMVAAPAFIPSASAETDVNIRIGTPAYKARAQGVVVTSPSRCKTVTTKVKKAGKTVISKKRVCR